MATMATTTCAVPDALFRRIQGEFLEMPGLCLTQPQACRLWGLDRDTCGLLLSRLVDAKFLTRTRDGARGNVHRRSCAPADSIVSSITSSRHARSSVSERTCRAGVGSTWYPW